jgi:hypothetical protein
MKIFIGNLKGCYRERDPRREWLSAQPKPNAADMRAAREMWRAGSDTRDIARELGFPEVFIYNRLHAVSHVYPDGLEMAV